MEPLQSAPPGTWSRLEGIAFDIDDTLTRNGVVEPEAFDAMWALHRAGLVLVPVTGRPLGWVDVIARHWPVNVAVGENGAGWVWRDGPRVREGYAVPEAEMARVRSRLDQVRARVAREMPEVRVTGDQRARRLDLAFDIGEETTLAMEDVERLMAVIRDEGFDAVRSTVHAHAVPGPWNKATGIASALRDALGIDLTEARQRWTFVGDSPNDAAAFAHFEPSVGVANVREHASALPVPPTYVTQADRGRGFAELANAILRDRTSVSTS
ncbi:MAG: HAD-IIB family hydrolase [Polyangiales bacterium]|nr:HAD-IIB family hydrolase [Myxococcales bacterium]